MTAVPTCPQIEWKQPPLADPTSNVIAFLSDAVDRQDDLRELGSDHIREILDLRTDRQDDLRVQTREHLRETANLRAGHDREVRDNEAKRLDAILTNVSDTAVTTAAAAETRATTLANQVAASADAMRLQVAAAAQASNDTLDRRFGPLQTSIEEIRKFQFETQGGKQQVVETHAKSANWGLWVGMGIAAFVGVNGLLLTIVGIVATIVLTRG
jgi:transglutaminase-like putative cysteine protease